MQVITFDGYQQPATAEYLENGCIRCISCASAEENKQEKKKAELEAKKLQREIKAYGRTELIYDVYCDRVNFIGVNDNCLDMFFHNRNIIVWRDRGGYSIDLKDAVQVGLPLEFCTYRISPDSRKKISAITSAKPFTLLM